MGFLVEIEKILERRRLVFHLRDGKVLAAFGQTAGGWGKVEDPVALALDCFSEDELQKLKQEGEGN